MSDHDFRPAFARLARTMRWDELEDPPTVHNRTPAPRTVPAPPPLRADTRTVAHTSAWRAALARAVKGRAA